MALGDITLFTDQTNAGGGSQSFQVVSGGSPPAINAGEPVSKVLGSQYVIIMPNAKPAVADTNTVGVSASTSSETATADGAVQVIPINEKNIWSISPQTAATYGVGSTPNQTTYNALVGARVVFQVTTGTWKILSTDSSGNGLVIAASDVTKNLGKVNFSFRAANSYLA